MTRIVRGRFVASLPSARNTPRSGTGTARAPHQVPGRAESKAGKTVNIARQFARRPSAASEPSSRRPRKCELAQAAKTAAGPSVAKMAGAA